MSEREWDKPPKKIPESKKEKKPKETEAQKHTRLTRQNEA